MYSHKNFNRTQAFEKLEQKSVMISNTYKSKMCNEFVRYGTCKFGNTCHYAHSEAERRKPPCIFKDTCKNKNTTCPYDHSDGLVLPKVTPAIEVRPPPVQVQPLTKEVSMQHHYKSKMCKNFITTGHCPYGDKCCFAHLESELRRPVCVNGNNCLFKATCPYDHTTEAPTFPKKEIEKFIIVFDEDEEEEDDEDLPDFDLCEEEIESLKVMAENIKKYEPRIQLSLEKPYEIQNKYERRETRLRRIIGLC